MPTNGQSEYLLFGIDGVPLFTYGMIGITTLVIAYSTLLDGGENLPEFIKNDKSSPLGILGMTPSPSPSQSPSPNVSSPSPRPSPTNNSLQGGLKRKHKKTRRHK